MIVVVDIIGYAGAILGIAMLAMRTMIPLRLTGIANNIASMSFGLLAGVYPTFIQHAILLPLNTYRLIEMRRMIRQVKAASNGDHSMEWLKSFMTKQRIESGEIVFRKGDEADRMFYLVSGKLRLVELGLDLSPGTVVGELGFLAPDSRRTQTLVGLEDSIVLRISYESIEELYFQNPDFGFYFLRLTSVRLFDNLARMERDLAERDREIARLRTALSAAPIPPAAPPARLSAPHGG